MRFAVPLALLSTLAASSLTAAVVNLTSIEGFLHYGGGAIPQASFNTASPGFTSFLDANNLGAFEFLWLNTSSTALTGVTFTIFVDLDIDRDVNTFFNEHGEFYSNALPAVAPLQAIAFSQWEIDEPEYVFGNIYTNANAGALDNSTSLPLSGAPDDVSHALLFHVPVLGAGATLRVTGVLSATDAAGLAHYDLNSSAVVYVNGYATADTPSEVPEPASLLLLISALGACATFLKAGRQ